jgi:NAD(P)-dependent dehydrogenase (short-subunit alcohol dehydrogenase family)
MIDLKGKGALIFGAKRVGGVIAERLAQEGVDLAIGYRSSLPEAQALHDSVAALGVKACLVQGDLSREADAARVVSEAGRNLGGLHFVINLASEFPFTPFITLDAAAWDRAMGAAKGSYLLSIHAARALKLNPGPTRGHIILFGDASAGETPYRHYLPYLTSKAATEFMTRALAVELASDGILVNAISPGPTIRPPDIPQDEWVNEVIARTTPLRRESSPEDMAEIVVALLRSETITGEAVRIDAGNHLAGPYEFK